MVEDLASQHNLRDENSCGCPIEIKWKSTKNIIFRRSSPRRIRCFFSGPFVKVMWCYCFCEFPILIICPWTLNGSLSAKQCSAIMISRIITQKKDLIFSNAWKARENENSRFDNNYWRQHWVSLRVQGLSSTLRTFFLRVTTLHYFVKCDNIGHGLCSSFAEIFYIPRVFRTCSFWKCTRVERRLGKLQHLG